MPVLDPVLNDEFRFVGVPDSRLHRILSGEEAVLLAPREDLAVAVAFGLQIAGERPIVFMKDAGLGHCLDSILTTFVLARVPLLMIISTTTLASAPEHQRVWAGVTRGLLTLLGARVVTWSDPMLLSDEWAASRHHPLSVLLVES